MSGQHRRSLGVLGMLLLAGCSNTASQATVNAPLASGPSPVVSQQQPVVRAPYATNQPIFVAVPVAAGPYATAQQQSAAAVAGQGAIQPASALVKASSTQATLQTAAAATPAEPEEAKAAAVPDDAKGASGFSHAADYRWLAGQVEQTRLGKGWRLRYAAVDEDDQYGGSVTLVDDAKVPKFTDGQMVCVRGHLVDASPRGPAPAYHVDLIESAH